MRRLYSTLRGKRPMQIRFAHPWTQKQERILYHNIYNEYLSKSKPIDWNRVSTRVQAEQSECEAKFFQLQQGLQDWSAPRMGIWTRDEVEKVIRAAHKAEKEALRQGKREIDWENVVKETKLARDPSECQRVYDTYYYLCRVNLGLDGSNGKILVLVGVLGLVAVHTLADPILDALVG
ncbi:hypothetical protein FBU59_001742 [Linderina macrospora]|uniref:Uncharacterized protein n=1 Tax=Linderina macrospora TaxID=4868 RepID=A0ACC1JDF5_9FUNG|nr:hypothetical protein FBU59_001742 [Linderina macrospora]